MIILLFAYPLVTWSVFVSTRSPDYIFCSHNFFCIIIICSNTVFKENKLIDGNKSFNIFFEDNNKRENK